MARGGVLRITAESYNYRFRSGTLYVTRPRLNGPDNDSIASADRAIIGGLSLFGDASKPIVASIRNLQAKIVRLQDGRFAFEDYLPEQKPEQADRGFAVTVYDANILLVDLAGRSPYRQRAMTKRLLVEGASDDWIASGNLAMPGIGLAKTSVQRFVGSGLLIRVDSDRLNLGPLVNHLRDAPEGRRFPLLRDIQVATLTSKGPVRLRVPDDTPFELDAELNAEATGVIYASRDRFERAAFSGLVISSGARGKLWLARPGAKVLFNGTGRWSGPTELAGRIEASAANRDAIPVALVSYLPKDLNFQGMAADGWLAYSDSKGWRYSGGLSADSASWSGQSVRDFDGKVSAESRIVRLDEAKAIWQGAPSEATLAFHPADGTLAGQVTSNGLPLETFRGSPTFQGLSGKANVVALVTGKATDPQVSFRANGPVRYKAPNAQSALVGNFRSAGTFAQNRVQFSSLVVESPTGQIIASGTAALDGKLSMGLAARGLSLGAILPEASGLGDFVGRVEGTFANPVLIGRAEILALNLAGQDLPLVVADVRADRRGISASSIQAIRGSALASGSIAYRFGTGELVGKFASTTLTLSQFSDQLAGVVQVNNATIGGTAAKPSVDADLTSDGFVVAGRAVEDASARLTLRGDTFRLEDLVARLSGGTVTGSGSGDLTKQQARFELRGEGIALAEIIPEIADQASLSGNMSANAIISTRGSEVAFVRAAGSLSDVVANKTLVGSGSFDVNLSPTVATGSMQIGTLERYLELSNFSLDRRGETVGGDFTAYRIPLQELHSALYRYLPEPASDVERRLRRIEGVVDARMTASGTHRDPSVKVDVLELSELALEGRNLGKLTATLDKRGDLWNLERLAWEGEAGSLQSNGVIKETGDTRIEGELSNFDLSLLSIIDDRLARLRGRAGVSFSVDGDSDSPTIVASLDARRSGFVTGKEDVQTPDVDFGLLLDTVTIRESDHLPDGSLVGGINATGKLFYRGFEGDITANLPLKYPLEIPQGLPLSIALDMPPRELDMIAEYFPMIDPARTDGSVSGRLAIEGVVGSASFVGNLKANAEQFALGNFQTVLRNAITETTVRDGEVAITSSATSSEGGSFTANLGTSLGDALERLSELSSRGLDALLDRPVSGQLTLDDFGVRYRDDESRVRLDTSGKLDLSGRLRSPLIAGNLDLTNVNTLLPSWDTPATGPPIVAIDPRFNVKLAMNEPARVSTGIARLVLVGNGELSGSLTEPDLSADFVVRDGTVNLPTARVDVEPGGSLRLRYESGVAGDTLARFDVDLQGRTSLTTTEVGGLPQRYEIELTITGNLLDPEGANIIALSDPPGLSQQRILALLGEADLIAGLVGAATRLDAERQLRNTLVGYALPALFEPFTRGLAQGLGLEYLSVDYNPFHRFSLSFAKTLGRHLVLQGRRQISQPLPGFLPEFELKLTYRIPFGGRQLRRVAVSVGLDQDRPWKISAEYGLRF